MGECDGAALAPVGLKEGRGPDVLARQHRARNAALLRFARHMAQHAVTQVLHVGGAGAEIVILGGLIARDLTLERIGPGHMRTDAGLDGGEGRLRERVILQHRQLEAQHILCLALDARHQRRQVFGGLGDGMAQHLMLGVGASRPALRLGFSAKPPHRAHEEPVGCPRAVKPSAHRPLRRSHAARDPPRRPRRPPRQRRTP